MKTHNLPDPSVVGEDFFGAGFMSGLIASVLLIWAFNSTVRTPITPPMYQAAEARCTLNEGVRKLHAGLVRGLRVWCNDGAYYGSVPYSTRTQ